MNGTLAIAANCHNFNPKVIGSISIITFYSGGRWEDVSCNAFIYVLILATGTIPLTVTDKFILNTQIVFITENLGLGLITFLMQLIEIYQKKLIQSEIFSN